MNKQTMDDRGGSGHEEMIPNFTTILQQSPTFPFSPLRFFSVSRLSYLGTVSRKVNPNLPLWLIFKSKNPLIMSCGGPGHWMDYISWPDS